MHAMAWQAGNIAAGYLIRLMTFAELLWQLYADTAA
jgi:hypothetical protein